MRKRVISAITFVVLVCLFAGFYFYTPLKSAFDLEAIRVLVDSAGIFGPILFGLVYAVVILFFIPATPLTVLSGLLFGTALGTVVVVIAATASASIAFLIARYFGKGAVSKLAGEERFGTWVKRIEDHCNGNGFVTFFILRNLFLPFIILSYAAGLVRSAKLRDFALATFVSSIIHSFTFVYLGDSLLDGPKALILPVVLIILVLQLPKVITTVSKNWN